MPVQFPVPFVGEIVQGTVQAAVEMCEPAVKRIEGLSSVAQVPFAYHGTVLIPVSAEYIGHGLFALRKPVFPPWRNDRLPYSEPARVASCHEARPGRGADRSGIVPAQLYAFRGDPVDVRCLYLAAVHADVPVSEVIGEDDHDIRLFIGSRAAGGQGEPCHACQNNFSFHCA